MIQTRLTYDLNRTWTKWSLNLTDNNFQFVMPVMSLLVLVVTIVVGSILITKMHSGANSDSWCET